MLPKIASIFILGTALASAFGDGLIGCKFQSDLCDESETCVDDGVFGSCQLSAVDVPQYRLTPEESELLHLELQRLVTFGDDWRSNRVQCVLRYFFFVLSNDLDYDPNFCDVRKPGELVKVIEEISNQLDDDNQISEDIEQSDNAGNADNVLQDEPIVFPRSGVLTRGHRLRDVDEDDNVALTDNDEKTLNYYIWQVMNGQKPDLRQLDAKDLDKFIVYVQLLENLIRDRNAGTTEGEVVNDSATLEDDDLQKYLYKKDEEKLGILNQGTGDKEHRIQTRYPPAVTAAPSMLKEIALGHLKQVEGNRVYIRLNKNITLDNTKYVKDLMDYLDENVAKPKNLTFDDFRVSMNEISFRVHSAVELTPEWLRDIFPVNQQEPVDVVDVAEKAYHMTKKTQSLDSPFQVRETGLGTGENSVPVRREPSEKEEDNFVVPTLIVCCLVIGTLVVVLGLYVYRSRTRAKTALHLLAADLEGKPSKDYQELCRQRMSGKTNERVEVMSGTAGGSGIVGTLAHRLGSQSEPSPPAQTTASARSSTSSWSEEPVQTNMDISTGHSILTYMEDHLLNKDRLDQEWGTLEGYQADTCATTVADSPNNAPKNRFQDVLPYDHSRVTLSEASNENGSDYINASFICDHDPRNPSYIAAQAPLSTTTADFWQMVWEQGSVVIVNLTKQIENGETKCARYWPENGSEVYHIYEIHLVSEHIWCTDYLVRSFYLKNLRTQETRTVTQFHFLTWPEDGMPASTKALLDFRRKVNKSYRGRSCPIVVHCSDGSGRTGTYCLLDMVLNRINKGVKEVDIAATLEHLRDQRMKFVRSAEQFEFVLTCVAEEVQAVLKALQQ